MSADNSFRHLYSVRPPTFAPGSHKDDATTLACTVFFVADPSSIGASSAEFAPLVRQLESQRSIAATCVLVDFDEEQDPMQVMLEAFKGHSLSEGGNFVVGIGYGAILALRLASIFTRNSVGGLLLLSCPAVNSRAWHPRGGSGSGPAWFEASANLIARLFASSWPHGPTYAGPCLMYYMWPRLLRQHVEARYSSSAAQARGRFGAATVEGAVRRAFDMGPLSHVARCARCVRPFHLRDDFFAAAQLVTTTCVVGEEEYSGGGTGPSSSASVCAALGLDASRLVVVPESGRQCVEEQPHAVADALLSLVAEADRKRAAFGLKNATPTLDSSKKKEAGAEGGLRTESNELFNPDDFATF